jgi:hypothetical protein
MAVNEIRFEFHGEVLTEKLEAQRKRLVQALTDAIEGQSHLLVDAIKTAVSGDILWAKTGALRGSVRTLPIAVNSDETEITGGATAGGGPVNYAKYLEEGVDHPWVIEAKRAKVLAFIIPGPATFAQFSNRKNKTGFRYAFALRVTHPALEARGFMANTLMAQQASILAALQAAADEAMTT